MTPGVAGHLFGLVGSTQGFYPSIHFWPLAEGEGLGAGEDLKIPGELAQSEVSLSLKSSHIPTL